MITYSYRKIFCCSHQSHGMDWALSNVFVIISDVQINVIIIKSRDIKEYGWLDVSPQAREHASSTVKPLSRLQTLLCTAYARCIPAKPMPCLVWPPLLHFKNGQLLVKGCHIQKRDSSRTPMSTLTIRKLVISVS